MRAMDVMTANVITVGPDTSVQDLARLLSERGISGVPVVNSEERLVGIVSEGDLLHRAETGTDPRPAPRRSWWLNTIAKKDDLARDYVKSYGRKVKDIMTTDVVSVTDTTQLADVAVLDETDQARPCRSRRQDHWYRQQGEPSAGIGGDEQRARHRCQG